MSGDLTAPYASSAGFDARPISPMRGQISLELDSSPAPNGRALHKGDQRSARRNGNRAGAPDGAPAVEDLNTAQMFDKRSLAQYFRVSVDTIERLVKAGELPAVRIGNQVRFTLEDVDRFIHRHRTTKDTA